MKFIYTLLISMLFKELSAYADNSCKICKDPLRIMVLLDESGTVGKVNFNIAKKALNHLVDNIDISNTTSQMGIIKFSTNSVKVIDMSSNINDIKKSIDDMEYRGGWTNTKSAISLAHVVGKDAWNSTDVTKILLLITDGLPQLNEKVLGKKRELAKTLSVMDDFKDTHKDVDVISIAIGEYSNNNNVRFFKKISDYPVFLANNYTEVLNLFSNLSIDICTTMLTNRPLMS